MKARLAKCPLAVSPRLAAPFITYRYGGQQTHHLLSPSLWRHIWIMWRGKRLWAAWWYLTHRRVA